MIRDTAPSQDLLAQVIALRNRVTELETENARLRGALENRKLVERAKGVLMARHRWTEPHAYRWLQQRAMNERMQLAELARRILTAGDGPHGA